LIFMRFLLPLLFGKTAALASCGNHFRNLQQVLLT
jgi:hypothetical protein